jgi:hypothetical protein
MEHSPQGQVAQGQPAQGEAVPGQVAQGRAGQGRAGQGQAGTERPWIGQTVMPRLRAFLAFWYDFVVGDDWVIALGVVVALFLTYAVSQTAIPAWWLMPAAVGALLPISLRRLTRRR